MFNKRTLAERLLAAALCLVLLLGMLPTGVLPVFAAKDNSTVGTNEETTDPSVPEEDPTDPSVPDETVPGEPVEEALYGTVTGLVEGVTVDESDPSYVKVSNGAMTLQFFKADPSIGRYSDGWWFGVRVDAPEGMDEEALANAVYGYSADAIDKNFLSSKDGEFYITLWGPTTPEYLKKGLVNYHWYFDWDGEGEAEPQHIHVTLDAEQVTLLGEDGKQQWPSLYADLYSSMGGEVTGWNTDNTVLTVKDQEVTWRPEDKAAGRPAGWTIDVVVVDPQGKETTYWLELQPKTDKGQKVYTGISGKLDNTFDWGDGVTQYMAIVAENITLLKAENPVSFEQTTENKKNDLPLYQAKANFVVGWDFWNSHWEASFTNKATVQQKVQLTYKVEVVEGSLDASIDNQGKVTVKGNDGLLLITVEGPATDTHEAARAQYYLLITEGNKGKQELKFNSGAADKIQYNPEAGYFDYSLDQDSILAGTPVYTITKGTDVASVDADGKVTTLKAGTFTIQVSAAESADFYGDDETMTVTVEKAEQKIEFVENNVVLENGTASYQIKLTETEKWFAAGSTYSFAIDWAKTTLDENTTVDANGLITFAEADNGTLTVLVTRVGDDCFKDWSGTFTVELKEAVFAEDGIKYTVICGDGCDHGNGGWHTGPVTITAEGYTLFVASDTKAGENPPKHHSKKHGFTEAVTTDGDGVHTIVLCLKADGKAQHTQHTITVKIDTTAPDDFKFEYSKAQTEWPGVGAYGAKAPLKVTVSAKDANSGVASFTLTYTKADGTVVTLTETAVNGKAEFTLPSETEADTFDGYVTVTATDKAGNTSDAKTDIYRVIIDNTIPTIVGSVSDPTSTVGGMPYYADKAVYTITITEKNFFSEDVKVFDGEKRITVDNGWTANGDAWTANITLDAEGVHDLKVLYTDRSGNEMAVYAPGKITIDKTAPVVKLENTGDVALKDVCTNQMVTVKVTVTDVNFDASTVVATLSGVNPTLEAKTVAFRDAQWTSVGNDTYVNYIVIGGDALYTLNVVCTDPAEREGTDEVSFTVEMTDPIDVEITFADDVWGKVLNIVTFGYYDKTMTVEISASDVTSGVAKFFYRLSEDAEWVELLPENDMVSFKIDPQYKGQIQYYVVDKAGNDTVVFTGNPTIIVDDIKPTISVTWPEAKLELEDGTLFYDGEVIATVVITEKNFFNGEAEGEIPGVKVFDNGTEIVFDSADWTLVEGTTESWMNTVTLKAEEDHVLRIEYADRSKNPLDNADESLLGVYESGKITIDTINPVISLDLDETPDRLYFADTKVITLTVVERNFNADKVQFLLTAKDVSGKDLDVAPVYSQWSTADDGVTHTITLTFDAEANYTLDVTYADEAGRESNDLAERLFTVDKSAPEGLTISYSTNVWGQLIDTLTFGYYNVPVTVTITANDSISGVNQFLYSYIRAAGVSGVNVEKLEKLIAEAQVEQVDGGYTFRAQFKIPETELEQINGKISFTAVDRANNQTTLADDKTLVVDNIRPNASVNYNAPVQTVDGVSYYAGNIDVTLTIVEANFFAEDVKVTVTKDGVSYPVEVTWSNVSADDHIGTFTLTEDGDYVVSVSYTDRSNNTMDQYSSNQLTIDTVKPEATVSGIVNNSANTDKTYSFTITASDINFDVLGFQPVLVAVVRQDSGNYSQETINLGDVKVVAEGNTYTFEIANLEKDAIYTLTCTVKDLAGNTTNTVVLDDGKAYEKVQFSINRNGSTFALDEYTQQLVKDYYVQNVTQDLVVFEVNADILTSHTVTLNDKELVEGTDYTVTSEGGGEAWMKYTYTISKALLTEEGEYTLVIASKDKAGNDAYSDVKDATVSFVVDRTAPVITVTGMANNGRYQTDKQTVTLIPTDDGGALSSVIVRMVDDNGNLLNEVLNLSGDALTEALEANDGKLTFQIGEGLYQNVQVICTDSAAGENGSNVYNETFTNLSVSANAFMIFWANTGLRWGVIGGTGAVALGGIFLLLAKKKKKEDKEEAK